MIMKTTRHLAMASILALPMGLLATQPILEPYQWQEDFESGTTEAWESYPPFQDTAYDFTIYPGRYVPPNELRGNIFSGGEAYPLSSVAPPPTAGEENEYYLLRGFKPDGTSGGSLGMWVKLYHLFSADNTEVEFDYWLDDRIGTGALEVHLAGGDGQRYVSTIENPARREWERLRLSGTDFSSKQTGAPLPPGISLDAIAVMIVMVESDPSAYTYLAIDNVVIDANRSPRMDFSTPEVVRYKHWEHGIVERVHDAGEPLELNATLPGNVEEASLELSFGVHPEHSRRVALSGSGQQWGLEGGYDFPGEDPLGPWLATVTGYRGGEPVIQDTFRFWRLAQPPQERPRTIFSAEDVAVLRERAQDTERGNELYSRIVRNAERARTREAGEAAGVSSVTSPGAFSGPLPPESGDIHVYYEDYLLRDIGSYFTLLRTTGYDALNNAFVYLIDGDEEAGDYARQVMLQVTGWDTWLHPNFPRLGRSTYYPIGQVAIGFALTYDMIHPLLSEEEKEAIREGIMRNAVEGGWKEYFLHNRVANGTSNWISGAAAGPMLTILSMYDSHDAFPSEFAGLGEKLLSHLKWSYLSDGSYGEGQGYQAFSVYKSGNTMVALKQAYGVTGLIDNSHYAKSFLYPIYIAIRDISFIGMGDNYNEIVPGRAFRHLAPLAYLQRDPLLTHFFSLNPGNDWRELVWPIQTDIAQAPDDLLPPSRVFDKHGSLVFRNSWEADGSALHFRAGPHFNHTHADQGHFNFWSHGEMLAYEAELSMYYDDPYFWSYFVHAGAHNTLIVDGNIQSQEFGDFDDDVPAFNNHARLLSWTTDGTSGLARSDLVPVYSRYLDRYERSLAFTPGGNLIVMDEMQSNGGDHDFHLFYHPPIQGRTEISGDHAVYSGEEAQLVIKPLAPDQALLDFHRVPTPIRELRAHPNPPAQHHHVLRVGLPSATSSATFLTAYLPSLQADDPATVVPLPLDGGHAVELEEDGASVTIAFSNGEINLGAISANARQLMATGGTANPDRLWVLDATSLAVDGNVILESPEGVSAVFERVGATWQSVGLD